jgi:hypothetical protein
LAGDLEKEEIAFCDDWIERLGTGGISFLSGYPNQHGPNGGQNQTKNQQSFPPYYKKGGFQKKLDRRPQNASTFLNLPDYRLQPVSLRGTVALSIGTVTGSPT